MPGLELTDVVTRPGRDRVPRRVLFVAAGVVALLAVGTGVAFAVHRKSVVEPVASVAGYPIVWPASSPSVGSAGAFGSDPARSAQEFLRQLSIPTDGLTFTPRPPTNNEPAANEEVRTLRVTGDGRTLGDIHLKHDDRRDVWGVQAMDSPRVTIRSPEPEAAVNPPLSVAFRSDLDGSAEVRLFDARTGGRLGWWQGSIDPATDLQANANFTRGAKPFPGYLVLTVSGADHRIGAVVVRPLTVGAG